MHYADNVQVWDVAELSSSVPIFDTPETYIDAYNFEFDSFSSEGTDVQVSIYTGAQVTLPSTHTESLDLALMSYDLFSQQVLTFFNDESYDLKFNKLLDKKDGFENVSKEIFSKELISKINEKDKNSLSKLLNIFDGLTETPRRIIIATTNNINYLDNAFIRPGRFDIKIEFTKCTKEMVKDIINNFLNTDFDISKFKGYKEKTLTPAEVNQICFENYESTENILKIINL